MFSYYRRLAAEEPRIKAFEKGIEAAIGPKSIVSEIGSGLGTYSFLASRAGAKKVYSIEESPIIDISRKLYSVNQGTLGEIVFINDNSINAYIPEKVDVVIYENYDCQGLTFQQECILDDSYSRFLKPGGTFIPSGLNLYWVPLEASEIWEKEVACLREKKEEVSGFDFSLTGTLAANERIVTRLEADKLLADPVSLSKIDFCKTRRYKFTHDLTILIKQKGTLHGFGSWVDFLFPGGHLFSLAYNRPLTSYARSFFPLPERVQVNAGDIIKMKVSVSKNIAPDYVWTWWGEITDRKNHIKSQWNCSTMRLLPFTKADLTLPRIMGNSFKPSLNKQGRIRKRIFELIDGKETVEEIARNLYNDFPEEIGSLENSLGKVARIIKKYSS
ncbi:hypothetical protein ACFL1Z_04755 [Thermodesulfobacteriota bacterium]